MDGSDLLVDELSEPDDSLDDFEDESLDEDELEDDELPDELELFFRA